MSGSAEAAVAAQVAFQGSRYAVEPGETVLDCLTRHGALLPSKCKAGSCRKCMVRVTAGNIPAAAQKGLRNTMIHQGYLLACLCKPEADLAIAPLDTADHRLGLTLTERTDLAPGVVRLRFDSGETFRYRPGQSINLIRPTDEKVRSYCLATMPDEKFLEIHIRRAPGADMGPWLCEQLTAGDPIAAYGPVGDCFYLPDDLSQPLLLVALDSGLGAIYGMLKDALAHGQYGPIHLIHAAATAAGVYLSDTLSALAGRHPNLTFTPCITGGDPPPGGKCGKVDDVVTEVAGDLSGFRIYLAGDPAGVKSLRRTTFLNGADMAAIYAVSFNP